MPLYTIPNSLNRKYFFTHWLPLILWLSIIFFLSSQVKDDTEDTSGLILGILQFLGMKIEFIEQYHVHFYVRKLAHFTEYFVLCILSFRLFSLNFPMKKSLFLGWLFSVLYACSDEFHQTFVAGRGASVKDVLIDASGAAIAALCIAAFLTIYPKFSRNLQAETK
ncbi:MAG: VanZ family protein [Bacteroidia bacterium]|nr:VanZ family protein [Bacteroidia bacterium]